VGLGCKTAVPEARCTVEAIWFNGTSSLDQTGRAGSWSDVCDGRVGITVPKMAVQTESRGCTPPLKSRVNHIRIFQNVNRDCSSLCSNCC